MDQHTEMQAVVTADALLSVLRMLNASDNYADERYAVVGDGQHRHPVTPYAHVSTAMLAVLTDLCDGDAGRAEDLRYTVTATGESVAHTLPTLRRQWAAEDAERVDVALEKTRERLDAAEARRQGQGSGA